MDGRKPFKYKATQHELEKNKIMSEDRILHWFLQGGGDVAQICVSSCSSVLVIFDLKMTNSQWFLIDFRLSLSRNETRLFLSQ